MGVKRDNVPFAGVNEGTESPDKAAKAAKRTFAAGLDLQTLKQSKLPPEKRSKQSSEAPFASAPDLLPLKPKNPIRNAGRRFQRYVQAYPHINKI